MLPPPSSLSTSHSSTAPKTLVSFTTHPLKVPFLAYVAAYPKDDEDPYDLKHLAPPIAAEMPHRSPSSTSSSRRPRYYLVHKIEDNFAFAWLITSLGSNHEAQEVFLEGMRKKDANMTDLILPLDSTTRAMACTYPIFPKEQLQYHNPQATQKNPLEGFLVVPAEARFPVSEFVRRLSYGFSLRFLI